MEAYFVLSYVKERVNYAESSIQARAIDQNFGWFVPVKDLANALCNVIGICSQQGAGYDDLQHVPVP